MDVTKLKHLMGRFEKGAIDSKEMFVLDQNSAWLGVSVGKLMENAGMAVARHVLEIISTGAGKSEVHVFCGTGNNGGDGLVAARCLSGNSGVEVTCYLIGDGERVRTPESKDNWAVLKKMPWSMALKIIKDEHEAISVLNGIKAGPGVVLVDALLGTGIQGDVREPVASVIRGINVLGKAGARVVSVDVPSGLDPDTGAKSTPTVIASSTVSFHSKKTAMAQDGVAEVAGDIIVAPIGIPPEAGWVVGAGDARFLLGKGQTRGPTKGKNGRLVVVGGSELYSGAPALAAMAACRCGVDLVNVCVPEPVASAVRSYSPDFIVTPLPAKNIDEDCIGMLKEKIEWADTVVLGPGGGVKEESLAAFKEIIEFTLQEDKSLVIDADGLKALKGSRGIASGPWCVLTPHVGELSVFTGLAVEELSTLECRVEHAADLARELGSTIVLKGEIDVIASTGQCKVNLTGTPAMTVGGTGDVLAGLCGGLITKARRDGRNAFLGACVAAFVNGLAGEECHREIGGPFMTASMMLGHVAPVLGIFAKPG